MTKKPYGNNRDNTFSQVGSELLLQRIEQYWKEAGHPTPQVWTERWGIFNGDLVIRSNMLGGQPKEKAA